MPFDVEPHLAAVRALCLRLGVDRLELFGSGAGPDYDPSRSDLDFIVEFGPQARAEVFARYFAFKHELEMLLGRPVDLVMAGAIQNPYFAAAVQRTRKTVYASAHAEAA